MTAGTDYLKERTLEPEPIMLIGLGESIEKWKASRALLQPLIIPIGDGEELIGSLCSIERLKEIAYYLRNSCGLCRYPRQQSTFVCATCPWMAVFRGKCTEDQWYTKLSNFQLNRILNSVEEDIEKRKALSNHLYIIATIVVRSLYLIKDRLGLTSFIEKRFIEKHESTRFKL